MFFPTMFLPSESSSLQKSLPTKLSSIVSPFRRFSLQNVPHSRIFLSSERLPWSIRMFLPWKRYSPQMFLPWKRSSPQNIHPLKAFLPSECSTRSSRQNVPHLKAFLPSECSSLESVPPLRMFLPWKCSSPQHVPPLKAFLPSKCSYLESVPPLRMFLPSECSSNKNIPPPPHSMFPCWKFISGIRRATGCAHSPVFISEQTHTSDTK